MGKTTNISWTDATWNIARGCSKVNSDCKFCYMMRDGQKFGYDGKVVERTKTVFTLPDRLPRGTRVFMSSLTDVFHPDIDPFREEAYAVMRRNPGLQYQILTKRWRRMGDRLPKDWGEGWPNVWLGCSAGNQKHYDLMMPYLQITPAVTKWVSLEPLHGPIANMHLSTNYQGTLSWVVIGGESGNQTGKYRYRECHIDWLLDIIRQCRNARIPVFVKQVGTYLAKKWKLEHRHGGDWTEWPEVLRIREMPKIYASPQPV